ncbi:Uncharacterized protein TCM_040758 [Theobroma cacao]|uniref:RNase H type-1 domain-containing protein n=1 Tax=Theobroma cacao TaxID=3641 RepID=A0A061GZB3_THECC|nr:Uncharacterized protein TCM_040758 [Theobroma cacao]
MGWAVPFSKLRSLRLVVVEGSSPVKDALASKRIGKEWDGVQLFELIKVRMVCWVNVKWPCLNISIEDLVRCSITRINPIVWKANRGVVEWSRPEEGWFKFDTDDSSKDNPNEVGITGNILCDEAENVLWRMRKVVIQISNILSRVPLWVIKHIPRSANHEVDNLAKIGVQRTSDFLVVGFDVQSFGGMCLASYDFVLCFGVVGISFCTGCGFWGREVSYLQVVFGPSGLPLEGGEKGSVTPECIQQSNQVTEASDYNPRSHKSFGSGPLVLCTFYDFTVPSH